MQMLVRLSWSWGGRLSLGLRIWSGGAWGGSKEGREVKVK